MQKAPAATSSSTGQVKATTATNLPAAAVPADSAATPEPVRCSPHTLTREPHPSSSLPMRGIKHMASWEGRVIIVTCSSGQHICNRMTRCRLWY